MTVVDLVPEARLDNTQTTLRANRSDLRERRFDLRDDLRRFSAHRRLCRCGRVRTAEYVTMRLTEGVAGYSGLESCGSVWVCPVCSAKIMLKRGLELAAGVDWWTTQGNRVLLATNTVQHHGGHKLADSLAALTYAWSRVTSGTSWVRDREALGLLGYARALEVLHNVRNGWHPHNHSLLFVSDAVGPSEAARFEAGIFGRYRTALQRKGFDALPIGQRVDLVTRDTAGDKLGPYLTKMSGADRTLGQSLGFELTGSQSKTGRSIGRTQWTLGASAAEGNLRDQRHWREFEKATHGKRQLSWSKGLRDALRLGVEQSDDAIAAEAIGTEADTVGAITDYAEVLKYPGLAATLLTVLEDSGWLGVRLVLNGFGIGYLDLDDYRKDATNGAK